MKTASVALIALLDSQTFMMADLLTITLKSGTVLRYCSWDTNLTVSSVLYSATGLKFKRGRVRNTIGVEVDSMDLTLYAGPTDLIGSETYFTQLRNGALDGARIKIDKTFMPTAGVTTAGSISVFSGRISSSKFGRTEVNISVVSDLILLNVQMPRNVYQPPCLFTLYDDDMLSQGQPAIGCRALKSSFVAFGAISVGVSTTTTLSAAMSAVFDTGWFDLGYIIFTTGVNAGQKRTVKTFNTDGTIVLTNPLLSVPNLLDIFEAYPGCDHSRTTCETKFNNIANFRGFPYVPTPETAV